MEKALVVVCLIVFAWWAYPHVARNEWFAPTPLPPSYWGLAEAPSYEDLARPPQGYGLYRYDVWNGPSGEGRPVTRNDVRLQSYKTLKSLK